MFAGDLTAKSTHAGSVSVLDFLVQNHLRPTSSPKERIFAVRGNHDQLVVQWRSWREWFEQLTIAPTGTVKNSEQAVVSGKAFVDLIEEEWSREKRRREADPEEWVEVARKRAEGTWREEWWRRIPPPGTGKRAKEWKLFGDHYWLAQCVLSVPSPNALGADSSTFRDMTADHAAFLYSLPLINHVPSLHYFVVHAGLLPYNPRLSIDDRKQPLAHPPKSIHPSTDLSVPGDAQDDDETFVDINFPPSDSQDVLERRDASEDRRQEQEASILTDIKQNKDSWTVLNMRGVLKNGKITRYTIHSTQRNPVLTYICRSNDEGTPWSKLWNRQMKQCSGLDTPSPHLSTHILSKFRPRPPSRDDEDRSFPCEPSTVVYGHAASRNLDVKRYSMGIDSGCLYGQHLTALVIRRGSASEGEDADELERRQKKGKGKRVKFGDAAMGLDARVVQIKCSLPPESDSHHH